MNQHAAFCIATYLTALIASPASRADFTWFNNNFTGWQGASGAYATCSFTEFSHNTWVTDQYEDLGVLFTNPGPNVVHTNEFLNFPIDGSGIDGNGGIELTFLQPTYAVAAHGPDLWRFKAYLDDQLVFTSPWHLPSPGGFAGFASSTPFDRLSLVGLEGGGSVDDVYIDNIYFSTVPAPSVASLLALWAFVGRRRVRACRVSADRGARLPASEYASPRLTVTPRRTTTTLSPHRTRK